MTAHQMVCHLCDAARMAIGTKSVSRSTGRFDRTLIKWVALYAPLSWPPGILTRPEVDQKAGGTAPADFAADVEELVALTERMAASEDATRGNPHPIFGAMSRTAWMRWAYLHMDHHLRQFGL